MICSSSFFAEKSEDTIFYALKPVSYAEQQFALGRKIPLSSADLYDLELIPGVADNLASNIIEKRSQIILEDQLKTKNSRKLSFEMIHGVGNKTAEKLARYLSPE